MNICTKVILILQKRWFHWKVASRFRRYLFSWYFSVLVTAVSLFFPILFFFFSYLPFLERFIPEVSSGDTYGISHLKSIFKKSLPFHLWTAAIAPKWPKRKSVKCSTGWCQTPLCFSLACSLVIWKRSSTQRTVIQTCGTVTCAGRSRKNWKEGRRPCWVAVVLMKTGGPAKKSFWREFSRNVYAASDATVLFCKYFKSTNLQPESHVHSVLTKCITVAHHGPRPAPSTNYANYEQNPLWCFDKTVHIFFRWSNLFQHLFTERGCDSQRK